MATIRHTPICPNGHGEMDAIPRLWALDGWDFDRTLVPNHRRNGLSFLVRVFVCKTCGSVQLYEPPEEHSK